MVELARAKHAADRPVLEAADTRPHDTRCGRYNLIVLSIIMAVAGGISAFNAVMDPLMMIHRPWFGPIYVADQRYRVPGFARKLDYDTAIVGGSSAEALDMAQVRETLGVAPVSLLISGSTIHEESMAMSLAAGSGKVRTAIWFLDPIVFNFGVEAVRPGFPAYLYRTGPVPIIRYVFDVATLRFSVKTISAGDASADFVSDLDHLYAWPGKAEFSAARVSKAYHSGEATDELLRRERTLFAPFTAAGIRASFHTSVEAVIAANPGIRFDLVLGPSPISFYQYMARTFPDRLTQQFLVARLAYELLANHQNVRLFDFRTDASIVTSYDHYKDMTHFSPEIGHRIVETIGAGRAADVRGADAVEARLRKLIAQTPAPGIAP